jgi:ATP phosphoribosyltransferase regulatory subunit
VARDYLASHSRRPAGRVQLSGAGVPLPRAARPSEFLQAGIESFGRQDRAAADAETLALALEATSRRSGVRDVEIRTGDVALFNALLDALELYPVWRRRLVKDFNRKVSAWTEDHGAAGTGRAAPRPAASMRACWRRSRAPTAGRPLALRPPI